MRLVLVCMGDVTVDFTTSPGFVYQYFQNLPPLPANEEQSLVISKISETTCTTPSRTPNLMSGLSMLLSKVGYQQFDYFCVLDFEATCGIPVNPKPQEIIEFAVVLMNANTLEIEAKFHHYVRPTVNPILLPFCKKLTSNLD